MDNPTRPPGFTTPTVLLAACLALLVACGGGESTAPPPFSAKGEAGAEGDKKSDRKALEARVKDKRHKKVLSADAEFRAKPEWDMLSPHFLAYVGQIEGEIHSKSVTWKFKDAFASHEEKFYPPVEVKKSTFDMAKKIIKKAEPQKEKTIKSILDGILPPDLKAGTEGELGAEGEEPAPKDPLTLLELKKYSFRIIMTGIATPEAVVEDPSGNTYVVHVNDRLGSEGGRIVEIFKHKILVAVPDQPLPLELSLAPDTLPDTFASQ